MLNFKAKSHKGRSTLNKSDALCIVEIDGGIKRVYAQTIPNKKQETIIPIIVNQVEPYSIIWTDEHRSYSCLSQLNYLHSTVCHKYEFINHSNGTNTQAVESFHNEMKIFIKKRKGIKTGSRDIFLNEFCFYWNNKNNHFQAIIDLLKLTN